MEERKVYKQKIQERSKKILLEKLRMKIFSRNKLLNQLNPKLKTLTRN